MTKCTSKFRLLETLNAFGIIEFNYTTLWDPEMHEGRGGVFFVTLLGGEYYRFDEEE
jgi:hypothetical protein